MIPVKKLPSGRKGNSPICCQAKKLAERPYIYVAAATTADASFVG